MSFLDWKMALLAHPAEATVNQNTSKFLTAFGAGSSAAAITTALAEDEHALILARSPGESTALLPYHNFVNFGGRRTCPEAKLAVLEILGPLAPPSSSLRCLWTWQATEFQSRRL